jgi:hypothetical protein
MSSRAEVLGETTIGCEEALGVSWGFEPLHAPLPLAGRLVGVLRTIIEIPVLMVFHPGEHLAPRGRFCCKNDW